MNMETMTSQERAEAAIRLDKPDRVPIAILATGAPFARIGGITNAEFYSNEHKANEIIFKIFDECGGWDLDMGSLVCNSVKMTKTIMTLALGLKLEYPGLDLPDDYAYQAHEEEVLKQEDYATIAEVGWVKFMTEDFIFRILDITPAELNQILNDMMPIFFKGMDAWSQKGVVTMYPASPFTCHPFFRLSLGRSMVKFTEDLYYNPENIDKALKTMTREFIETTISGCKIFDSKITLLVEERAGCFFYPPKIFERFWWPYTKEIVDALWSEGIVTWFHLDTNWDKNIPYFKQLPRGSVVLALDGTSDIFAAKEVLRNHACLCGDVQASLLSLGTEEQVEAYCERLIDEVGADGGFFLSSGCELPAAIKPGNLKAMIRTGKTYEFSKQTSSGS
jgi:uroporphyrinogen-III decarboxylase